MRTLFALFILALPVPAFADPPAVSVGCPRYYVLLFGGQADRLRPRTAHTWATFVRADPRPGGVTVLEEVTISWLPCRMPVHPFALDPVPGRNYGLRETLEIFHTERTDLSLWGPFEIREAWFRQAVEQKRFLDSGAVRFKTFDGTLLLTAIDAAARYPDVSHCVHAVTRTDEALRRAVHPVTWYGDLVTRKVAGGMERVGLLVNPNLTHDWLLPVLGVDEYRFTRRGIGEANPSLLR